MVIRRLELLLTEMEMRSCQDSSGVLRMGICKTHNESMGWGLIGGLACMIWTEDMTEGDYPLSFGVR
jgi:hypothetical protein